MPASTQVSGRVDLRAIFQGVDGGGQLLFAQHAAVDENLLEGQRPASASQRVFNPRLANPPELHEERAERLPFLEPRLNTQRLGELLRRERAIGNQNVTDRQFRIGPEDFFRRRVQSGIGHRSQGVRPTRGQAR